MGVAQRVIGPGLTGGVTTADTQGMAVVPAPYDSQLYSMPATNTQATVTFPATPGKTWVLAAYTATIMGFGIAGAVGIQVDVLDGAVLIWRDWAGITAASATITN